MIPNWGWRSVLQLGGATPLVLSVLLLLLLPESVRYMVHHGHQIERIRHVLRRISPAADRAGDFVLTEPVKVERAPSGIHVILSSPLRIGSMMLWLTYFMGLVIFYALINWMPILFRDAGLDPKTSTLIASLFPLGGVGAIAFGWLMDRFNANRINA